ncbi:helix-turn-helix transcriptional regulator [Peribacillus frigoritolerans]|uniref:helix-turn-helix transcriptional regulator n=1 Tax=Peribacillus frigoritolerans TaxID=450367 RepID=UPI0035CF67CE
MMNKETVKMLRLSHGLNRTDFAEKVGISRQLVVSIEDGHRRITPRTARLISQAFALTEEDLTTIAVLKEKLKGAE